MGFFSALMKAIGGETVHGGFGRARLPRDWWKVDGFLPLATGGTIAVVGESHYQPTFEKVVGERYEGGVYWHVVAQLFFISDNEHDPNAVGVMIEGEPAGYIARNDAPALREAILAINPEQRPVICKAEITGGLTRRGDRGSYGLTLDVAQPLREKKR